eukprot:GHVH01001044.1.p1 GENE.GHVH01001044.1~~GHVH01001044.1.p1  ORF type:complete len:359 (-),score=47.43 GHVH01001044.1:29-1105(-)
MADWSQDQQKDEDGFPARKRIRTLLKNDYNQHYVDTGEFPQNFIRDHEPDKRFLAYAPLARLSQVKQKIITARAHPPQYLSADLRTFDWNSLPCKFDVLLIDPPWEEYQKRSIGLSKIKEDLTPWSLEELSQLPIPQVMESPSFCFLWVGSSHREDGRKLLGAWGYRRCEDIVWLKTNKTRAESSGRADKEFKAAGDLAYDDSIFIRSKEHCLMGIRGTVRRGLDSHLINSNLDIDVIVGEVASESASTMKPEEMYNIIERFCLSRRRLELFGSDRNIRPGWLTIGNDIHGTQWNAAKYMEWVRDVKVPTTDAPMGFPDITNHNGGRYLGTTSEIETLRPKSPLQKRTMGMHIPQPES